MISDHPISSLFRNTLTPVLKKALPLLSIFLVKYFFKMEGSRKTLGQLKHPVVFVFLKM